jgi:hypothetical protein
MILEPRDVIGMLFWKTSTVQGIEAELYIWQVLVDSAFGATMKYVQV